MLKTLISDYDILGIDFRTGSFYPMKTSTVSKQGSPLLIKGGAVLSSSNYYKFATYALGLNDFTCIVRNATFLGAGTTSPLTISGGNLRLTLDGTNYDSSIAYSATAKSLAVSADRSGNVNFSQDGVQLGASVDISAKVAVNIATTIYSIQNFDSRYSSQYGLLIIGKALTATEIAKLTAELDQMPDQRVSSTAIEDGSGNNEILFKGEMNARANETTVSTGFLENTGFEIITTNAQLIVEKINNTISKAIKTPSAGLLRKMKNVVYGRYHFYYFYAGIGVVYLVPNSRDDAINSTGQISIRIDTDGSYTLRISGSVFATAAAGTIPTNEYCHIDFYIKNDSIVINVNGVEKTNYSYSTLITGDRILLNMGINDKCVYASNDEEMSMYQEA